MMVYTAEQLAAFRVAVNRGDPEAIDLFAQDLNEVVNRLAINGWTLPGDLGLLAIKRLADSDDIRDVDEYLQWYYTQEDSFHMKMMVDYIAKYSRIKSCLKVVFGQCWQAYQSELYVVCAISLLAIIEGVLSEFSHDKTDTKMMKVCQAKVDSYLTNEDTFQKYTWISYNMFIRNLYHKSDFTESEPGTLNRHWLLHGRSNFEVEQIDCIKLFNAVLTVCTIYDTEYDRNRVEE